ncbi:unnamed protein product, partial [Mesorhabditis belari]|uniref:Uncharacterized protein n=1 Tax=Mesorhabditis belari TaxID=2138241 RepID=A0AAF3FSI1_9BILA
MFLPILLIILSCFLENSLQQCLFSAMQCNPPPTAPPFMPPPLPEPSPPCAAEGCNGVEPAPVFASYPCCCGAPESCGMGKSGCGGGCGSGGCGGGGGGSGGGGRSVGAAGGCGK